MQYYHLNVLFSNFWSLFETLLGALSSKSENLQKIGPGKFWKYREKKRDFIGKNVYIFWGGGLNCRKNGWNPGNLQKLRVSPKNT